MPRSSSARSLHVVHAGSSFEDAEAVDEMYHEVAPQGIVFGILRIAGGYATGDVTALFQYVVYLETECRLFPFQERFGGGGVP